MVKQKKFFSIVFIVSFIWSLFLSVFVYADRSDVDSLCNIGKGQSAVIGICNRANEVVDNKTKILVYTGDDGILSFSNKEYKELDMDTRREFMEVALSATKESGLGTQTKNKVYNFIEQQDSTVSAAVKYLKSDASADFVGAKAWFRPFSGVFGTIMGFLCLAIFIFLGASIVFDCSYLVLPGMQLLLEHGHPERRPFGVSREAWKTQQDLEKSDKYVNVVVLYAKRRIGIVLICSLCLAYVISGKVYDVIIFFIDVFLA